MLPIHQLPERNNEIKMKLQFNLKYIFFIIIISSFTCSGYLKREYPQKKFFVLEPDYSKINSVSSTLPKLVINKLRISPLFEGKNFVYRQGEFNYESDYYNEFFVFPSSNLIESIRKWLDQSTDPENKSESYNLSVYIESMYIDLRDPNTIQTVWEIVFTIESGNNNELLLKKKYSKFSIVKPNSPEGIIISWNTGLTEILSQLRSELNDIKTSTPETENPTNTPKKRKKK